MQSLKDEITQLQAKNAELLATIESQKGEIAAHEQRVCVKLHPCVSIRCSRYVQIHVLEEAHVKLKTLNRENNQKAKTRFEREGAEIQRLNALTTELQARVESLTQELDEAKAHSEEAAAGGAPVDPELAKELEALRTEKANLEQLLAQEKAAHLVVSSQVNEQTSSLVSRSEMP